jgi:hypothetical protein
MVSLKGEHDCMRRKKHGSLLMTASMPPAAAYFRPWITWIIARQGFLLSHASISFFNTPPFQTLTTSTSKSQRRSNWRNRLWSRLATTLSCYGICTMVRWNYQGLHIYNAESHRPIPCRPPVFDTHCHTIVYIRCSTKYLSCCTGSYISTYGIRLLHMKATSHDVRIQYSLEYTTVAESGPSYAFRLLGRFKKQNIYIYIYIYIQWLMIQLLRLRTFQGCSSTIAIAWISSFLDWWIMLT